MEKIEYEKYSKRSCMKIEFEKDRVKGCMTDVWENQLEWSKKEVAEDVHEEADAVDPGQCPIEVRHPARANFLNVFFKMGHTRPLFLYFRLF